MDVDNDVTVGDKVTASASRSSDPDGKIVKYEWDLDGNGEWGEDGKRHTMTFDTPGDYSPGLRVTDDSGNVTETHVALHVADTAAAGQPHHVRQRDRARRPQRQVPRRRLGLAGVGQRPQLGRRRRRHVGQARELGDAELRRTPGCGRSGCARGQPRPRGRGRGDDHGHQQPAQRLDQRPVERRPERDGDVRRHAVERPRRHAVAVRVDLDDDGEFETTGARPSVSFATPGRKTVRLRVTDDDGGTATAVSSINVTNQAPRAVITLPATRRVNTDLTFDGTGSSDPDGTVVLYEWDLDNNGSYETVGPRPVAHFMSTGTRTIGLRVTDAFGLTATASRSITITT